MAYSMLFIIGLTFGAIFSGYFPVVFARKESSVLVDALYYLSLPKSVLVRQLLLRDVQLKVLLRTAHRVKTTPLDRLKILALIRGFPAWKDHVSIVAASTVRNWMVQFPKGIWSLRTWIGILKCSLLVKLGRKKKRASHNKEEVLAAMRTILITDRIRGLDRIHGELIRLGFEVSRSTVALYLRNYFPQFSRPPHNGITPKQLLTSIWNAWATDFWVVDQFKKALAKHPAPECVISDNDSTFRYSLAQHLKSVNIKHVRTQYHSPWQNGIAERWIQTARREVFDRIPIFSSRQMERLLEEYIIYYNHHRTHLSLCGDSPVGRSVTPKPSPDARLVSESFADGLAHRFYYEVAA